MLKIYKASAGSGKTYTLAKDYIRLLLGTYDEDKKRYFLNLAPDRKRLRHDNRHRHILAITFTRKATEEMKTRILQELQALANKDAKSPYAEDLINLYGDREALALTAEMAMNQILFDYGNFQVSTIDSFFQRVLHTFARELDRQTDYNVELQEEDVMKAAVGAMLDDFNSNSAKDSQLETFLYNHLSDSIEKGNQANLLNRTSKTHGSLVKELSAINKESFKEYASEMEEYLKSGNLEELNNYISRKGAIFLETLSKRAQKELKEIDLTDCIVHIKNVLQQIIDKKPLKLPLTKTLRNLLDSDSSSAFKKSKKGDFLTPSAIIRSIISEGESIAIEISNLRILQDSIVQLRFLAYAWGYLTQFSKENNSLLISDTNELVRRIIANDDTPFIYERMGVRLGSFLIDEFQDTSKMQWENLHPLIGNGLSQGFDSLVIGDEKQSIYRFRNSDASILHEDVGKAFVQYLDNTHDSQARSTNYRSSATVVKFNNSLFSVLAPQMEVIGFENVVQNVCDKYKDQGGYVRFERLSSKKETKEAEDEETEGENIDVDTYALEQMSQHILRQLSSGYKGKDIAILTNTNTQAAKVVDYLLRNHFQEIKVVSDEAMRITASTAVRMIISLLRIIDMIYSNSLNDPNPTKRISRAKSILTLSRLTYLMSKEEDAGTEDVTTNISNLLRKALDNTDENDALNQNILFILKQKPSSLVAMVETIIGSQISETERRNQFAFIAAFQDMVLEYVTRTDGSLHSFLDWWDTSGKKRTISGNVDPNAVRVMTIHKSKGLEFKCVLIPFCDWERDLKSNRPPKIWISRPSIAGVPSNLLPPSLYVTLKQKDAEIPGSFIKSHFEKEKIGAATDTLNKTYVAFTRAQRELLVWYKTQTRNPSIGAEIDQSFVQIIPQSLLTEDLGVELSTCFDAEKGLLVIGAPTIPDKDKEESTTTPESNSPDHWETYPVNFRADRSRDIISVDDIFDVDRDIDHDSAKAEPIAEIPKDALTKQEDEEARFEGIVLHDIMSGIYTSSDLQRATASAAARHHLTLKSIKPYQDIVENYLAAEDERIQRWYDDFDSVYIEQPIYIPNMNYLRRPDRIVINNDGTVDVIDYKFTEFTTHSGTPEQMRQVKEYMKLMKEMGHRIVRGYLVYPRLSKIIEVE